MNVSIKSISFQLRKNEHPFIIDYDVFDIYVLHSINRILDIENHDGSLVIEVPCDIFKEIGEWILNNHWIKNATNNDISISHSIKIDGHNIIFTKK